MGVSADVSQPGALHDWVEMTARAVEDADRRLRDLRLEEWRDGGVAAVALALAIAASAARPPLALPLLAGGLFVVGRAVLASLRRSDLLDRLVGERDAYSIAEVRVRAEQEASLANRRRLSRVIRTRLELGLDVRVTSNSAELAALSKELVDPLLELDPACAVACSRLLTDHAGSPLLNSALPAEDVRSRLRQIRAGFHPGVESELVRCV